MNKALRLPYGAVGGIARALTLLVPRGDSKFLRALSSRNGLIERYRAWASEARDERRQLVWIHAPSVGEGLQALPVARLLRERRPDVQIAFTFFSPSAAEFSGRFPADFRDYLPFDTGADARKALDALRPTALVFSKLDVWPVLAEHAARRGVRLGLISGTMPASSLRSSGIARLALADAYGALERVGAISVADADRLAAAGAQPSRISVTGDTRYDQVWEKAHESGTAREELARRLGSNRPTLVAGSTWPADERHLLAAWEEIQRRFSQARLIIAPHEVGPAQLRSIEEWAARSGLRIARLAAPDAGSADVVLVDRYGVLGDLYALADLAYVGGGFHRAGLHSLLEPAAFGVPVITGPRHSDNRDAALLVAAGGAARCSDSAAITRRVLEWLHAPKELARAGAAARDVVRSGLGAAEQSLRLVESLLDAKVRERGA